MPGPPLPKPRWYIFKRPLELTLQQYRLIKLEAQKILSHMLLEKVYDSVNGLLSFYDEYKRENTCLHRFFKKYTPKINDKNLTCVGMAMELIQRWHILDTQFPNFAKSSMLVSCEQEIEDVTEYVLHERPENVPRVDKEHVLVCVKIKINGRFGVMLADPGFHIAQIITVMLDQSYPHTGYLIPKNLQKCRKVYSYNFNARNSRYIEWHNKRAIDDTSSQETSLIYVAKRYLEGINVTIRRNLVYEFKSLVGRNKKGKITAGIYFKIRKNEKQFVLISTCRKKTTKTKFDFALFAEGQVLPKEVRKKINRVNSMLHFKRGTLANILQRVGKIIEDEQFVQQMSEINKYIQTYTDIPRKRKAKRK